MAMLPKFTKVLKMTLPTPSPSPKRNALMPSMPRTLTFRSTPCGRSPRTTLRERKSNSTLPFSYDCQAHVLGFLPDRPIRGRHGSAGEGSPHGCCEQKVYMSNIELCQVSPEQIQALPRR